MLNNKRLISISLFILALSFSLVKAQDATISNTTITTTTDNTTTVNTTITILNTTTVNNTITTNNTVNNNATVNSTTVANNTNFCSPTNVSRALECWLQPNCLPCIVSNGFVCLPMLSNGTQVTGNIVCESNCGGYVPNPKESIWDGERPWIYKMVHRQDMKSNRTAVSVLSQSYFENVTQQFESIREWSYTSLFNTTSLQSMQSLVNQTSNATTIGQSTINQTMSTLMNDWSLDIQQNQNFTNTSITDLAQMWSLRYQAINQSLINATYTAQLVRQYYNISSVYYCFAAQRLQQHLTVLREFLSLVETVQEVALYSSYQQMGLLYEQRYLCSSSLSSNGTDNMNGTSQTSSNSTLSSTSNSTTSGNVTVISSGNSNSNSTSGTDITVVQNVTVTTNVTTVTNTTTNTTITTSQNSTSALCSSWNSTYFFQNITAEQVKQNLIWYYLYQIEEVRAYIEEVYANASDLVTKKCEQENYFGSYLDSQIVKLGNNQCVSNLTNLFNVTANTTFVNDTMDILMDFMEEIDYVNATVVNQNDNTTATNLTWLFTVQRDIDWDNETFYNVSTEFCDSIIPYLVAVYGAGVNTTWCNATLAQIINETHISYECNETFTNQSSNVPSPSSSNSSNVPSPSASSSNSTVNVPSPSTETNVPSPSESSSNSTVNVPSPSTETNTTLSNSTSSSNTTTILSNSTTITTPVKRQADIVLPENTTTTVNITTVTVNTTIQNTTIVVVNSTVVENGTVSANATVPCPESAIVPSPSVISTNQTGNNTNCIKRRSRITFTIPVYMFPCNATNVTITTNGTVSNCNETVSNSTVPAPNGNSATNSTSTVTNNVPQPVPSVGRQGNANPPSGLPNSSSFLAVSVLTLLLLACMV